LKKLAVVLFAFLALAACAGGKSPSIEGQWKLVSYTQTAAAPDVETSIEFKDGQMSGNVGCNSFGGDYTVDGGTISFDSIMSTMMFCEGPVGDQELAVLSVLQESATFVMEGNTLMITSANGDASIVLERK
jgi:heat shock protein HslJ